MHVTECSGRLNWMALHRHLFIYYDFFVFYGKNNVLVVVLSCINRNLKFRLTDDNVRHSLVLKYSSRIQILTEYEQWTMALSSEQSVQISNVNVCLI